MLISRVRANDRKKFFRPFVQPSASVTCSPLPHLIVVDGCGSIGASSREQPNVRSDQIFLSENKKQNGCERARPAQKGSTYYTTEWVMSQTDWVSAGSLSLSHLGSGKLRNATARLSDS